MAELRRRRAEYWAGLGAVIVAVALLTSRSWPVPDRVADGVLDALLADPVLIGMLRLALLVVALYGIASVPVLAVRGRWATSLGTSGVVADDARADAALEQARRQVAALQNENITLGEELDELWNLVDDETRPL